MAGGRPGDHCREGLHPKRTPEHGADRFDRPGEASSVGSMPIIRVDNYLDAYRLRAHSDDPHDLAARPDKKEVTEFVNRRILEALQPGSDDFVVDIGCGEGSLLRMVDQKIKIVGIVGTPDEQRLLE